MTVPGPGGATQVPEHIREASMMNEDLRLYRVEVKNMGFSWGAFELGLIWVIANKVWMPGLLLLMPALILLIGMLFQYPGYCSGIDCVSHIGIAWNFCLLIYLGFRGHELAWRNREFAGLQQFKDTMAVWNKWGFRLFIVTIILEVVVWVVPAIL